MKTLEDQYRPKQSFLKRIWKSMPKFMRHYWINSWGLIAFSVVALILLIYFLHIDRNRSAFVWSVVVLSGINAIRFFGLLIKWRDY